MCMSPRCQRPDEGVIRACYEALVPKTRPKRFFKHSGGLEYNYETYIHVMEHTQDPVCAQAATEEEAFLQTFPGN